jgi:hypothetical protein
MNEAEAGCKKPMAKLVTAKNDKVKSTPHVAFCLYIVPLEWKPVKAMERHLVYLDS